MKSLQSSPSTLQRAAAVYCCSLLFCCCLRLLSQLTCRPYWCCCWPRSGCCFAAWPRILVARKARPQGRFAFELALGPKTRQTPRFVLGSTSTTRRASLPSSSEQAIEQARRGARFFISLAKLRPSCRRVVVSLPRGRVLVASSRA